MAKSLPYLKRSMASSIRRLSSLFPCILLTGARQVGKSTLLREIMPKGMRFVSLDDVELAHEAQTRPLRFLERMGTPLLIDEVQYAPTLFRAIKKVVDENRHPGMYWMTGSQRFQLMKGVSEGLPGRLGIVELDTMSQWEIAGKGGRVVPFNPAAPSVKGAPLADRRELFKRILRGGYPELVMRPRLTAEDFFHGYLLSYVERDVQALSQVGNKSAFVKLMRSAASRTGQQLVFSNLARDADVTPKTAKAWVSILEASGIVSLVEPYYVSTSKRLVKAPKLYFMDTGLASWLNNIHTVDSLEDSLILGALVETYAYGQLVRNYRNRGRVPEITYYRDSSGAEVDFLLQEGNTLYPLEVKASEYPHITDLKHVKAIPPGRCKLAPGMVLCTAPKPQDLTHGTTAFPISAL
ncbi:MAG: ATP-binding protein [Akkermansia sp.]|nr:ATP-binding protein [Akkermansia sp.]